MNYITKYKQISENERFLIYKLFNNGLSMRFIAKKLQKNVSSVSHEIKRNLDSKANYDYSIAQTKTNRRRLNKHSFK